MPNEFSHLYHPTKRTLALYELIIVRFGSCLFVCFVALRPKSTAMVIAGRSVHITTLFPGRLEQEVNQ